MAYDGSLVFNTEINTDGLKQSLSGLGSLTSSLSIVGELGNKLLFLSDAANRAFQSMAQVQMQGLNLGQFSAQALVTSLQTAVNTAITAMAATATSASAQNVGGLIITNAANGVLANSALQNAVTLSIASAKNYASSSVSALGFQTIGLQMVMGIAAGINAGAGSVANAMVSAVSSAVYAAKSAAKIQSPSRVFNLQVGRMLMKGIEEGILYGAKNVQSTMAYSMNNIVKQAKKVTQESDVLGFLNGGTTAVNANNFNKNLSSIAISSAVKAGANNAVALMQTSMANTAKRFANTASLTNNAIGSNQSNSGTPVTNLYMTVNTHDSLSESELTRQAEDFLTRTRRKLP